MINREGKTKRDIALLIIINKEGKLLLQHRSEHLERWPGYWGFFGGGIEEGETPEEGLKREIHEELGYRVENHKLLLEQDFVGKNHWGVRYIYACEHDESQEFILCSESQGCDWYHVNDLDGIKLHREDYKTIRSFNGKFL